MNQNPYPPYNPAPPKKNHTALVVTLIIVGVIVLALIFVGAMSAFASALSGAITSNSGYKMQNTPMYPNVAVIWISGTISAASDGSYDQNWLISTINSLINDTSNEALCISMNTPGGAIYQTDEVYLTLLKYKETGRPIYVYMNELCASGGYYISCAADEIYANRNTLTGSIGVVMNQVFDVTALCEKLGIKVTTIYSGANKTLGGNFSEFTEEQQAIMQSLCDEAYGQFVGIVSTGRKMSDNDVRALADGRVYSAAQAEKNGLIDGIKTYDEFMDYVSEKVGGENGIPFVDYYYVHEFSFRDIFNYVKTGSVGESTQLAMLKQLVSMNFSRPSYYCNVMD
ncbi:MAG: signal peptide peptidase SppA [Oscillospiraceae bacterium]|nr:signal peptide peptidase SppA [Oscillospiraceae bacterium]